METKRTYFIRSFSRQKDLEDYLNDSQDIVCVGFTRVGLDYEVLCYKTVPAID